MVFCRSTVHTNLADRTTKPVIDAPSSALLLNMASNEGVSAEQIAEAEMRVGAAFQQELAAYFASVRETTNIAGGLLAQIRGFPGEGRAVHAAAVLLARILTELQACKHLVQLGYSQQAVTLTGTMQELAHTAAYIGTNEQRASGWFEHADPRYSYPRSVKQTINDVAKAIGAPQEMIAREYDRIYRDICMAKHGNPMALGDTIIEVTPEAVHIISGPYHSESLRRMAHAALQYSLRYTTLACIAFARDHLTGEAQDAAFVDLQRLAAEHGQLFRASGQTFKQAEEGT